MKLKLLIIFSFINMSQVTAQALSLPFANHTPELDGKLNDWNFKNAINIEDKNHPPQYRNFTKVAAQWDEQNLYAAFIVKDACLTLNEKGNNNPRLYLSDAVEIYLDSKNDSRKQLDINDYQFLVAFNGDAVIFKGDKEQIKDGALAPKDFNTANIVFNTKTSYKGSVNDLANKDEGYQVEMAIPWAAIGIKPFENMPFKIDFCVDDVDTVADFHPWPEDFRPACMSYVSSQLKTDFGFPADWLTATLVGKPSWWYRVKKTEGGTVVALGLVSLAIFIGLLPVLFYQYRKIQFLKNLPERTSLSPLTMAHFNKINSENQTLKQEQEWVKKARQVIENQLDETIGIDVLAQQLTVSPRTLQRLFKEEMKMTPIQFITIVKLEKAANLLRENAMNISEIAYATGFNNPAYFTNVFKKYFGMTPKALQEQKKSATPIKPLS